LTMEGFRGLIFLTMEGFRGLIFLTMEGFRGLIFLTMEGFRGRPADEADSDTVLGKRRWPQGGSDSANSAATTVTSHTTQCCQHAHGMARDRQPAQPWAARGRRDIRGRTRAGHRCRDRRGAESPAR
jgi:hypothetical protein